MSVYTILVHSLEAVVVISNKMINLSPVDRKLLKTLLAPDGKHSSKTLAKKLGIPATTVQRRRKRLEKEFLTLTYTLDLAKFGWHKVDFLIATESGKTGLIGKTLLKRDEVIYVGKSIGQHTIDLRVETILRDNAEILRMMELLKSMEGVKDVVWTEIVEVVGRKTSIPSQIIDQL